DWSPTRFEPLHRTFHRFHPRLADLRLLHLVAAFRGFPSDSLGRLALVESRSIFESHVLKQTGREVGEASRSPEEGRACHRHRADARLQLNRGWFASRLST